MKIVLQIALSICFFSVLTNAADLSLEYPRPHSLIQRDKNDTAEIRLHGRAGAGVSLEARFNGSQWQRVETRVKDGVFLGSFPAKTGRGKLEVRDKNNPKAVVVVDPVAVGDLFVVAGQDNAKGSGTVAAKGERGIPFPGVKFERGEWSVCESTAADGQKAGSPWPMVLNALILEQKVPMGIVQTAADDTVIKQWTKGGGKYAEMLATVKEATAGTMKVKALLFFQGESDVVHFNPLSVCGKYEDYKTRLNAMIDGVWDELAVPVLVGQITNILGNRLYNDNIRRAQQEVWGENPHALPGALTHDITPEEGMFFRSEKCLATLASRWVYSIQNAFYGKRREELPHILSVRRVGATVVHITFSESLRISRWDFAGCSPFAGGFRFTAGSEILNDDDVLESSFWKIPPPKIKVAPSGEKMDGPIAKATRVRVKEERDKIRSQPVFVLRLRRKLPGNSFFHYGSGDDTQGKAVFRSQQGGIPLRPVFSMPVE